MSGAWHPTEYDQAIEKAAGTWSCDLRQYLAGHTGQSSQLFPVTPRRNAQFLATIEIGLNVVIADY